MGWADAPIDEEETTPAWKKAPIVGEDEGYDYGGLAREVGQGLLFNFGDELEAGFRATGNLASGGDFDYRTQKDVIAEEMAQFQKENPKAALAANLAGAVPTMFIPALGQARALQLASKGRNVAAAATKLAGVGVEGAIAGAGGAESLEDIPMDAAKGAGFGVGTGGAMKSLGWAGKQLSKRRIDQDLLKRVDPDDRTLDEFTPYTVAADMENKHNMSDKVMRNVVKNLPASPMRRMEREYVEKELPVVKKQIASAVEGKDEANRLSQAVADDAKKKAGDRATATGRKVDSIVEGQEAKLIGDFDTAVKNTAKAKAAGRQGLIRTNFAEVGKGNKGISFKYDEALTPLDNAAVMKKSIGKGYDDAWGQAEGFKDRTTVNEMKAAMTKAMENVGPDSGGRELKKIIAELDALSKPNSKKRLMKMDDYLRKRMTANAEKLPDIKEIIGQQREYLRKALPLKAKTAIRKMDKSYPKYLAVRDAVRGANISGGDFTPTQAATAARGVVGKSGFDRIPHQEAFESVAKREMSAVDKTKYLKQMEKAEPSLYYNILSLTASAVAGGVGVPALYGLGTQFGQRALAGQVKGQGALRRLSNAKPTQDLSRALRRGATTSLTDDEDYF